MPDPALLSAAAAVFTLAGLVKGVIGLGLPTIAMGLLGLLMPPADAAALLVVPSLVTNIWQLQSGPGLRPLLRRLWPMLAAIAVATLASAGLIVSSGAPGRATAALGAALLAYAAIGLANIRLRIPSKAEPWAAPLAGIATGVLTGATGVFVIPAVPYLGALGLNRDDLVQALGLSFTASTLALAAGLAWHGALPLSAVGASTAAIAPALAGMAAGGWLRTRVRPATFRLCFFTGLLILGAELLWKGLPR